MINIQDEAMKIHSKFGITEKANYEIQLLAERYAKEYHEAELKKLRVGWVSGSVCEHEYITLSTQVGIIQKCKKCHKCR